MEQLRETEAALERARGAHATCAAGVAAALREAAEAAQAAAEAAAEAAAQADSAGGGEAAQVTSAQQAAKAAVVAAANAAKKAQKQSTAVTKVCGVYAARASGHAAAHGFQCAADSLPCGLPPTHTHPPL